MSDIDIPPQSPEAAGDTPGEAVPVGAAADGAPAFSPPPAPPRRRVLAAVAVLLFLLLLAAVGYLWRAHQDLAREVATLPSAPAATLEGRVQALEQAVAALQQKPAAAPVDLQPLEARIAALEQRPPPAPAPAPPPDLGPLAAKLDSVAAEAAAAKGAEQGMSGQLTELGHRLNTAEHAAGKLAGQAEQARNLARAQVALDAGQPLGDIRGAPPALARFAHAAPPTEASLRLGFPAAAAAAVQASRPSAEGKSFGERMWLRAKSLVTVKQGDRVLVGAPAAEVLGEAQAKLDAGDVAGAVAALGGLDGAAAQAMAPWREAAQSLLAARAALAQMARG